MYRHETFYDPACVKRRTIYVIMVVNCPIVWQSKLQSETTLSTNEDEIITLSNSCCKLFPIVNGVNVMGIAIDLFVGNTTIQVLTHKDNAGSLFLAKTLTPQSCTTIPRLFGFNRKLWSMGSRFIQLTNSGIYSLKDHLNQGLKISKRTWWDGDSLLHQCLRESGNGQFGKLYVLFNFSY